VNFTFAIIIIIIIIIITLVSYVNKETIKNICTFLGVLKMWLNSLRHLSGELCLRSVRNGMAIVLQEYISATPGSYVVSDMRVGLIKRFF